MLDCMLAPLTGNVGRVGLTTARSCILPSFTTLEVEEVLLCFKIPARGRVPILDGTSKNSCQFYNMLDMVSYCLCISMD